MFVSFINVFTRIVWLAAKESTRFDIGHFMQNLNSLTNCIWHDKLILWISSSFGFLPMTLVCPPLLQANYQSGCWNKLRSFLSCYRALSSFKFSWTMSLYQCFWMFWGFALWRNIRL